MVNAAWDDPTYRPVFESEKKIFELYHANDSIGLKAHMVEDTTEAYWAWQRIQRDRQHFAGYQQTPYILWAAAQHNKRLTGTLPAIQTHITRFFSEGYNELELESKYGFLYAHLQDEFLIGENSEQIFEDLIHIGIEYHKGLTSEYYERLPHYHSQHHYYRIITGYLHHVQLQTYGGHLDWMIRSRKSVNNEMFQKSLPLLTEIIRQGSVPFVSGLLPGLLHCEPEHPELLKVLQSRDDELSSPIEWLRACYM